MGASERALGEALGSRRDEAIIVTKFGMNYHDKPNLRDSSRERVIASIDKSLKNLGTDYVDVYLVHWPDRNTPFEETMSALDDIVREGKVRFVGLSNFKLDEIEACMAVRRVDVVQYGWNMFDRRMQREILPYCEENGIGFMAYGSLAFGLLTGTFTEDHDFGSADWRARQGNMGAIKMFAALFGPEKFKDNVRAVGGAEGRSPPGTTRSCRSSRCAGRPRTRPSAPRSSAVAPSPRSRTTSARSAGRSAPPISPRSTRSSHATTSTPPPISGSRRHDRAARARGQGRDRHRWRQRARPGDGRAASSRQGARVVIADVESRRRRSARRRARCRGRVPRRPMCPTRIRSRPSSTSRSSTSAVCT